MEIKLKNLTKQVQELKVLNTMRSGDATYSIAVEANSETSIDASQLNPYILDAINAGIFSMNGEVKTPIVEAKVAETPVEVTEPEVDESKEDTKEPEKIPEVDESKEDTKEPETPQEDNKNAESNNNNLICKKCGAEFGSKSALSRHLNSAHK